MRARATLPDCALIDNPDWEQGMGASLRAGLTALAGTDARAALVLLVDQPGIGPEAVARVRRSYRSPRSLVSAAYDGVRGHPVLFGAEHWAGIAATATGTEAPAPISSSMRTPWNWSSAVMSRRRTTSTRRPI